MVKLFLQIFGLLRNIDIASILSQSIELVQLIKILNLTDLLIFTMQIKKKKTKLLLIEH